MVDRRIIEEWLAKAENDFQFAQIVLAEEKAFDSLKSNCDYLNAFYIHSRYPMDWPVPTTRDKAQRALDAAEQIRAFVRYRLST